MPKDDGKPPDTRPPPQEDFAVKAPAISLPKGGGAIRGIDEKFSVNPVTGTASLSVPIFTTPGRSDFAPKLSLDYDSGAGNGPFGLGWTLSIPAIARKTDKGLPRYRDAEESDVYILSGAEDLVPALAKNAQSEWDRVILPHTVTEAGGQEVKYTVHRYRPRIEGLFARIERWQNDDGDVHWRSISKDNVTTIYGKDPACRLVDPDDPRRVFKWLIEETRDDKGNIIVYEYKPEDEDGVDPWLPYENNRLALQKSYANKSLGMSAKSARMLPAPPMRRRYAQLSESRLNLLI